MSGYIKSKKDMKFQSQDGLKIVQNILDEATAAIQDKKRTIAQSTIPEILAKAVGINVASRAVSLAFFVAPVPFKVLSVSSAGIAFHVKKKKKLREQKDLCYKEAIKKQTAMVKALKEETNADKERIEYLTSLNTLLLSVIHDLDCDLKIS